MKSELLALLSVKTDGNFILERSKNNQEAIRNLKYITRDVPDKDGIYFVLTPLIKNRIVEEHLIYEVNEEIYEFIYFGIAGGLTSNGKERVQKLRGRINNVVGSNSIRRAIKWNETMIKYNFSSFKVLYYFLPQPKEIEDKIYDYLKRENLKFPLLNLKRGRPNGSAIL